MRGAKAEAIDAFGSTPQDSPSTESMEARAKTKMSDGQLFGLSECRVGGFIVRQRHGFGYAYMATY